MSSSDESGDESLTEIPDDDFLDCINVSGLIRLSDTGRVHVRRSILRYRLRCYANIYPQTSLSWKSVIPCLERLQ